MLHYTIMMADEIELLEIDIINCTPEEELFFSQSGVQPKTIKQMKLGKFAVQETLDLHGMTTVEAKSALAEFLFYCQDQEIRRALIIHGKGQAILKSLVATWLRNYENTLIFCSAAPKDGGTGALYLLLKRKKDYN